jgi:allantoate deiminase
MLLQSKVARIQKDLEAMAQFTATPGQGITRFSFTEEDRLTRDYIKECMRECNLLVYEDAAGTIIGRRPGRQDKAPAVMVGSHFDSVKNGGPFDGPAGVVTALEIARVLDEHQVITEFPIEFVALIEEEGGRFGSGLFGSRAMVGKVSPQDLHILKDESGISMAKAMTSFGMDPSQIGNAVRQTGEIKAFFELHIEQGPILETTGVSVGIVETVVGIRQMEITIEGQPDHAGTTPMNLRADALVATSDIIKLVNQLARKAGAGTVATVGRMAVSPGAANVVPGKVVFSVDIRSADAEIIENISHETANAVLSLPEEHPGIVCHIATKIRVDPVSLPSQIVELLEKEGQVRNISTTKMLSGAGHDAMVMAGITQVGLVFVPSKQGRSHCPEEWTDYHQLKQGVDIVLGAILCTAEVIIPENKLL